VKARAKRAFRRIRDGLRLAVTLGGIFAKRDEVREGFRVGGQALDALDPNEKALRDDYGVPPDRGSR
jgi:hypothetical protein